MDERQRAIGNERRIIDGMRFPAVRSGLLLPLTDGLPRQRIVGRVDRIDEQAAGYVARVGGAGVPVVNRFAAAGRQARLEFEMVVQGQLIRGDRLALLLGETEGVEAGLDAVIRTLDQRLLPRCRRNH